MKKIVKIILCVLAVILVLFLIRFVISRVQIRQQVSEAQQPHSAGEMPVSDFNESEVAEGTSTVYFTSDISSEGLMKVYEQLNWTPTGNVAVKLSTGEPPASNYLDPDLIKDLVQSVNGTIVENNTAYGGSRTETAMHMQVAEDHGFTAIADVDILDADGSLEIPVDGGTRIQSNLVGSHFENYDSYVVLSHFKGHAMAGFGGAIKNISIGMASKEGKCLIHTSGESNTSPWGGDQTGFTESMAEAGKSVSDYLGNGENIIYVSVLNNISIDCDCNGNPAEPDIHDIGIVASTDPVAIDQACIDLAFAAEGSESLQERVASRDGIHTLEHAEEIGLGNRTYAFTKEGLITTNDDVHYIDMAKLVELISAETQWSDAGLPELYGKVSVDTTDPSKSNSGNMFAALLANVLNNGETVTQAELTTVLPELQNIFSKLGYMETSSADLFSQFLKMGVGAKPIIAGYESQLLEYSVENPEAYEKIKDDIVMLYPTPTVWSTHVMIALNENGKSLLEALLDDDIQRLAWEKHGFRTGSYVAASDAESIAVSGIADTITQVTQIPAYSVMKEIIEGLQ